MNSVFLQQETTFGCVWTEFQFQSFYKSGDVLVMISKKWKTMIMVKLINHSNKDGEHASETQ